MSYSFNGRGRSYRPARSNNQRNSPKRSYIDKSRYVSDATQSLITSEVYVPKNSFSDFGLSSELLTNVLNHGYTTPTPIQDQAIPVLMNGQDVVGIANTGTGKTAAFLLPLINKVLLDNQQGALILAPTRELALQIFDELKAFIQGMPIGTALCIGGMNIVSQMQHLRKNPHFVIGTPGRLKDLINRNAFNPHLFTNVVLDEVDRMLDIGFRKDIQFLISHLAKERHSAFFSATMNRETEEVMREFLVNPITISVVRQETANHIKQDIITIKQGETKLDVLHQLLLQQEFEKVIVFGRTKFGINKLERQLYMRGIKVSAIHGNKSQNARQRSLQDFKQGRVQALLATDVAARGIDIEDVTHVINFDEPQSYDDYVHRIGRTGRAGKLGKALTFIG